VLAVCCSKGTLLYLVLCIYPSIWVFHDVFAYPFLKFHCFFGYMDCFSCSFQYPCAELDYLYDYMYIWLRIWSLCFIWIFGFFFCLFICLDILRSYSLRIYVVYGKTLPSNFHAQISGQFFFMGFVLMYHNVANDQISRKVFIVNEITVYNSRHIKTWELHLLY